MGDTKDIALVVIGGNMAAGGGGYGLMFFFMGMSFMGSPEGGIILLSVIALSVGFIGLILFIIGAQGLMTPSPYPKHPYFPPPGYYPPPPY